MKWKRIMNEEKIKKIIKEHYNPQEKTRLVTKNRQGLTEY